MTPEFIQTCQGLRLLVEGCFGTFRNEDGLRLKDSSEWCSFYVQLNHLMEEGEREVRDSLPELP